MERLRYRNLKMKQYHLQLRSTLLLLFFIVVVPIYPSVKTHERTTESIRAVQELVYIPIEADTHIYEHPFASSTNYGNSEVFILGADSDGNKYDPLLDSVCTVKNATL